MIFPDINANRKREGCPSLPGMPWGLAFETWDPTRKGKSKSFATSAPLQLWLASGSGEASPPASSLGTNKSTVK
ncbi:MAG: hypothetical protein QOJ42_4689 [Acidobacteriaceae bacterium]|jgi:hypothetical protein|nr:hypothetical protein [Acidobacteriaceae bacterium]